MSPFFLSVCLLCVSTARFCVCCLGNVLLSCYPSYSYTIRSNYFSSFLCLLLVCFKIGALDGTACRTSFKTGFLVFFSRVTLGRAGTTVYETPLSEPAGRPSCNYYVVIFSVQLFFPCWRCGDSARMTCSRIPFFCPLFILIVVVVIVLRVCVRFPYRACFCSVPCRVGPAILSRRAKDTPFSACSRGVFIASNFVFLCLQLIYYDHQLLIMLIINY